MNRQRYEHLKDKIIRITFKLAFIILFLKAGIDFINYGARMNELQSLGRSFENFASIFNAYVRDHPNEPLPRIDELKKNTDFYMDNLVFVDSSVLQEQKHNMDILYFSDGKPADWLTPDKIVAIQWISGLSGKEHASVLYGNGQMKSLDSSQWEALIGELIFGHNPPRDPPQSPTTSPTITIPPQGATP